MSNRTTVHLDGKAIYDIVIERSFLNLSKEIQTLGFQGKKVCIVTDTTVADYYLREVKGLLRDQCTLVTEFVFPAGESSKNLDTVSLLYKELIVSRFERTDFLIALGGGVVGDLCGYCAATYLRGISFIQIPTTLLSQVDSSIGGKTGVDFLAYKNMIGAFHMPALVYINLATLQTLTKEQFLSGMGEIIKHGLIKDISYYEWLKQHRAEICERDLDICEQMIHTSNEIKRLVVEQDPTEKGDRALLNFGHTFGHAIEKLKEFQWLHGQCVAVGCIGAAYLSYQQNFITKEQLTDMKETLQAFGLPISVSGLSVKAVLDATKSDKKMIHGNIRFALLREVGLAYMDDTLTEEELQQGISYILEEGFN